MQLSLVPFPFKGHQSTSCKANEEPLTAGHLIKIRDIEKRTIHCFPKNDDPYIKAWNYKYPSFSYTLPQLKEYLQETLSQVLQEPAECYLVGGAAHPNEDLPFNDIDIAIYLTNPDFEKIDLAIGQFIASHVQNDAQFNSAKMPVHSTYILSKAYYKHRVIFKDRSGAIYGLREKSDLLGGVDIKILTGAHFHSCGPTDGAQVSLSRYMLRYSLGEDFAQTKAEFQKADQVARKLFYEISHPEKIEKLFLRLLFKWTHLHTFLSETLEIAKATFRKSLKENIKKFEHEFENHYLNHYPTANGKICDFLNLLFFYQKDPQMCSYLANLWLRKSKIFQLSDEATVAELIIAYPFLVPHLLGFIGCLSYAASLKKREESKGSETAIKYRFSDADYPSIFLTEKVGEKERTYRISLGWSLEQLITLKEALPEALKKLNVGKDYLKGLLRVFQLDPADLKSLEKEPPKALDAPVSKESQLKGLEGDVASVKKDVPTHIKAILEYVKGDSKEDLSSEESYCKAFEMGLIPDALLFPILQKMIKSEKKEILFIVFQQLQIQIEKKGNSKAIFDIFKSIVNSKANDLDIITLQTVVQIYKCHPPLFEMCCQDQKLIAELLEIIRRNSNEFEVLTILLENAASNINHVALEIFNGWLNEKNVSVEQSVHFAIKLFERKVTLKTEVISFWILKIAIRALYSSSKQLSTGEPSSKIKDHAIRLLTLFPVESREEIRQSLLATMCQCVVKNAKKSSSVFSLLAEALSRFLPAGQAERFKSITPIEVVINRSEIAKYLVEFIEDNAPKLKEKEFYPLLQKRTIKKEEKKKKISEKSSEKLAEKLLGKLNNQFLDEFQEVTKLFAKLSRVLLKEKVEGCNKWIISILDRLIIYTDPNALSMATHLYKNAHDHQLLNEEELLRCGINLIRGYTALQDLDGSFNGSDSLLSIIKRAMKYEKFTGLDLIILFKGLKITKRLDEPEVFDMAFTLFSKLEKQNEQELFEQMDICLFDLLSHWKNESKYFDLLVEYINSHEIILHVLPRTFFMLLKVISISKNPQKLEILWRCFQYDKPVLTKLAYYQLLTYFDEISEKAELVYIQMGISLLDKYENAMTKNIPEMKPIIDSTRIILYCATRQQEYISRACNLYRGRKLHDYDKLSGQILDSFFFIPLKDYSEPFTRVALEFIQQLMAPPFIEVSHLLAVSQLFALLPFDINLQIKHSSRIIRVFAYFSSAPEKFPPVELLKAFGSHMHQMETNGLKIEERAIVDLVFNLSKSQDHVRFSEGAYVDSRQLLRLYKQMTKTLNGDVLTCFQTRINSYLENEHKGIKNYFDEFAKVDKRDKHALLKIGNQSSSYLNKTEYLFELYQLCNPELGKEILDCIYDAIMTLIINARGPNSLVILGMIRRGMKCQFYSHKKVGLLSTAEVEKDVYLKNMEDLNKRRIELIRYSLQTTGEKYYSQGEAYIPDAIHSLKGKATGKGKATKEEAEVGLMCTMTFSRHLVFRLLGKEYQFTVFDELCSKIENDLQNNEYGSLDILFDILNCFLHFALFVPSVAKKLQKNEKGIYNSLDYLKKIADSKKLEKMMKEVADEFDLFAYPHISLMNAAKTLIAHCSLKELSMVEQTLEQSSAVTLIIMERITKYAERVYETNQKDKYLIQAVKTYYVLEKSYKKIMSPACYAKFYEEFVALGKTLNVLELSKKVLDKGEKKAADQGDEKKTKKKGRKKK